MAEWLGFGMLHFDGPVHGFGSIRVLQIDVSPELCSESVNRLTAPKQCSMANNLGAHWVKSALNLVFF